MAETPNIMLVMTDQQRFDTVAALGNPLIQTPALDRLVTEGTSFTSAYCPSPVCVASRCSLLLGQWPHQTGCTANTPMPQDRTSLMEFLQDAGYQTHGIGKMHFSPDRKKLWGFDTRDFSEEGTGPDDFTQLLQDNGFDHVVAPHGERSEYYYIPQPSQLPTRLHHTQWVGDCTIDFLRRREKDRPFFCWSSFIKPHPPFESPVPWSRLYRTVEMPLPFLPTDYEQLLTYWNRLQNRYKYRDQGSDMNLLRTMRAAYYAAISFIDYQLGRIFEALATEGILDDTLILFTSDHGELLGDYNSYGKRSFLDVAARVPLLARYPERFPANVQCDYPASLVDVLPTCLQAAGLPPGDEHIGVDLGDLVAGQAQRDAIIGQLGTENTGLYMLLTGEFKYIYSAADRREWLFRRTPGMLDERSLVGNPAFVEITAAYRQRLIQWLQEDGYGTPLDGENWREFPPPPSVPANPDAGHLFQDGRSVKDQFPPGYEPRVDTLKPPLFRNI
ncbi:sulfatase-like hydrolase/transferase [Candidatus Poribacteria bacterium]|nr:sulfatase-like hydrolase/transferase [Candidatus Poribacteria bacterium]